ncbi:hypothetical protein, partial [Streptomyces sp. NPDC007960]|uniref:hypothetical protein n=1 Tax=Streptomyces sp. NPDC007960 TaxID=3364798 RepID=UPI0036E259D3
HTGATRQGRDSGEPVGEGRPRGDGQFVDERDDIHTGATRQGRDSGEPVGEGRPRGDGQFVDERDDVRVVNRGPVPEVGDLLSWTCSSSSRSARVADR